MPADITLLAPDLDVTVDVTAFRSKSKNSPFDGWTLRGGVAATIVGGRLLYANDAVRGLDGAAEGVRRAGPDIMTNTEKRERAMRELQQSDVLMLDGHFDYGNGYHGRVYLNPHALFLHPSTIWRVAQDLLDLMPFDLLEQIDVVAGPATGGALLAHTIAGLLDGRRSLTPAAVPVRALQLRPGARASTLRRFYATQPGRASACCSPTTCGTRGRRSSAVRRWCARPAARCSATAQIYDRQGAIVDLGVPNFALVEYLAPEQLPGRRPARCARRACRSRRSRPTDSRSGRGVPASRPRGARSESPAPTGAAALARLKPDLDRLYADYNRAADDRRSRRVRPAATRDAGGPRDRRRSSRRGWRSGASRRSTQSVGARPRRPRPAPAAFVRDVRARARTGARSTASSTGGRAAATSSTSCSCCSGCCSDAGSIEGAFVRGLEPGDRRRRRRARVVQPAGVAPTSRPPDALAPTGAGHGAPTSSRVRRRGAPASA